MSGNFREYRNREEMVAAGWSVASTESTCRNCQGSITWAKSPRGKSVPLDSGKTSLHFKTCSNGGAPTTSSAESALLRESLDECAQAVRELCRILRARAEGARQ